MEAVSAEIESERNKLNESTILKEKLEGQIGVLNEQIKAAELSDEHFGNRRKELESERTEKENQLNAYEEEKLALDMQLEQAKQRLKKAEHELKNLQESIQNCNEKIDSGKTTQFLPKPLPWRLPAVRILFSSFHETPSSPLIVPGPFHN